MCRAESRAHAVRRLCVESLELRLALTADAVSESVWPALSGVAAPKTETAGDLNEVSLRGASVDVTCASGPLEGFRDFCDAVGASDCPSACVDDGLSGDAAGARPIPLQFRNVTATLRSSLFSEDLAYAHRQLGLTGAGQTVAVIDSGIAYDHPALGGGLGDSYRVVGGWDFTEEWDADPFDDPPAGFHGTHVAGIIGGHDDQFIGVAPDIQFVALRVFNDQGASDFAWVEKALQWIHKNKDAFAFPITTVNLSIGASLLQGKAGLDVNLEDDLAQLNRDGIFVAVAAGNHFRESVPELLDYPASSPYVISVASADVNGRISAFSQRQDRVLVAPGEQITSTVPDFIEDFNGITDDYLTISGTSSATPFVAGASVLIRQAFERVGQPHVNQDQIAEVLRKTARPVYDPATRTTYSHIDLPAALDYVLQNSIVGLGTIESRAIRHLVVEPHTTVYSFTAARDGFLTIEVEPENTVGRVAVHLFDSQNRSLVDAVTERGSVRLDATVQAGSVYYLQLDSSSSPVSLRLTNLVSRRGDLLEVYGTVGDDTLQVQLRDGLSFSMNGVNYSLDHVPKSVWIHGSSGVDLLRLTASRDSETVTLEEGRLTLRGSGYGVEAWGFERQYVYGGGGGDTAYLEDTPGDDVFYALPDYSLLRSMGVENYVHGFAVVRAYSRNGGFDQARLYDSEGDDQFTGLPTYGLMQGAAFSNYASGFRDLRAYAQQGGVDTARLYDSSGDDRFVGLPTYALMEGRSYRTFTQGFESVRAYAYQGGADQARLYDSPGDDLLYGLPQYTVMQGVSFSNYVNGFSEVRSYSQSGGQDTARLYDSSGFDLFLGFPDYSVFQGESFYSYVQGFRDVRAYSQHGYGDQARFYGSSGDDTYHGLPRYGVLSGSEFRLYAEGFSSVQGYAGTGGHDRAYLSPDQADAVFLSGRDGSVLVRKEVLRYAFGFDQVSIDGVPKRRDVTRESLVFEADGDYVDELMRNAQRSISDSKHAVWLAVDQLFCQLESANLSLR